MFVTRTKVSILPTAFHFTWLAIFRSPRTIDGEKCKEFYLGQPNDGSAFISDRTVLFDEFHFWPTYKNPADVKELGLAL